jgi:hypothetical protein
MNPLGKPKNRPLMSRPIAPTRQLKTYFAASAFLTICAPRSARLASILRWR